MIFAMMFSAAGELLPFDVKVDRDYIEELYRGARRVERVHVERLKLQMSQG